MTDRITHEGRLCWREIGIHGDRSCEELSRYVHCRNCPVYSDLGRTLFDREIPGDYRRELSEEFAAATTTTVENAVSVLVFRLDAEWFALRSAVLHEIAGYQKPYILPFRSGGLLSGLVNVNGELLLCVSLEAALGLTTGEEHPPPAQRPRLCVAGMGRERVAFRVDEILGVRRIPVAQLRPVPVTVTKSLSAQTVSCFETNGHEVGLIDETRLFNFLDRSLRW